MTGFDNLIHLFQKHYYGNLIMGIFELLAIIIGLAYARNDKVGAFFISYLIIDFLFLTSGWWVVCFSKISKKEIGEFIDLTNSIVSWAELIAYYYFFSQVFKKKYINYLLSIFAVLFTLFLIFLTIPGLRNIFERYAYATKLFSVIGFLLLLPPCGLYYIKLFTDIPSLELFKRPSFWITTGIFFFALFSIPFYLLDRLLVGNRYEFRHILFFAFFFLPLTINFIFLSKAFLCKKMLTT